MVNINAYDEFGFILWYYAPLAYYHYLTGSLNSTSSKIGSKAVFYFSDNHNEKPLHNEFAFNGGKECYNFNAPQFTNNYWVPPPYKIHYKNDALIYDKPILTINNKNNLEWSGSGLFNFFNANVLETIFNKFENDYQIIYIRPPSDGDKYSYQKDSNQKLVDIGDKVLLEKHPKVLWIGDMLNEYEKSYNELQFMILANSEYHISCAGDSVIPSYFGGDVLQYNCPDCLSKDRGVWKTDSWLSKLSGSKIYGFNNYNELINKAIELWL